MTAIAKDIYWTGYIDWDLRNFHGYSTPSGSSYNAYLLVDEQPTLIDTVKSYGFEEMVSRIRAVIDPAKIRYIISNHTEMDHSGTIDKLLELCPQAVVVCSPKGKEGLQRHFKKQWNFKVVNSGDTLNIGARTLKFFLMPMVHWPDSMATYCEKDEILFPNDAFGQHYASPERFVDEIGTDIVLKEAEKYYANIVMPYGNQVLKALETLGTLPIKMICPSHGLIWREKADLVRIVSRYKKWAGYEPDRRAVIVYDTMWHSTEKMARALFERLDRENIPVKLVDLKVSELSDAVTEVMRSRIVAVGSAILNNRVLPSMGGFLTYLKGLRPKNRYGMTFGSYGWSTVGFKELETSLQEAGLELIGPGTYIQYIPDQNDLDAFAEPVSSAKKLLDV